MIYLARQNRVDGCWMYAKTNDEVTALAFQTAHALKRISWLQYHLLVCGIEPLEKPTYSFLNLTWVGWLNFVFLQWILIRLAYGDKWRLIFWVPPLCGWCKKPSPLYNNAVKHFRWPK